MKKCILMLLFLLVASSAFAQANDATIRIYTSTGGLLTTTQVPAAEVPCNLVPPTGPNVNPNKFVIDDPVNAGRACVYTDDGTGPFAKLPNTFANYCSTWAFRSGTTETPESNCAPFSRTPGAPANARLVRQ